ncbi:uncharacterized protein LOC117734737 [Cyclopterus lumpus]|uniref:uncharacterized protein LOC117734737 n=1 Tax=Cyclopterus lumpus TaxID=8103 RepID=UPI00148621F7|nr:uncharacterized protein LOC117734737 [Cyclopterus lumpus]
MDFDADESDTFLPGCEDSACFWLGFHPLVYFGGQQCWTAEPLVHRLSLTLLNVMPAHQGEYLCKLRSTFGAGHNTTTVIVQDCIGNYSFSVKESHAECWFSGVYPIGSVHWFQEEVNLTHSASTKQEMDSHGRYNVSSSIDVKKGNPNLPFECRLWKPSGTHLSQTLPPIGKQESRSSGSKVQLQWICVLVGIMTFMI